MKASEIRELTKDELMQRLDDEGKTLAHMRFQLSTSQLADTSKVAQVKKNIARLKTVLRERELQGENDA